MSRTKVEQVQLPSEKPESLSAWLDIRRQNKLRELGREIVEPVVHEAPASWIQMIVLCIVIGRGVGLF